MKLLFFVKLIVLLIVGLVVEYIIDPLDPSTISTPFLLGIILMGLSLRQSTPVVATTSLIYSAITINALIQFHHYHELQGHVSPHPYFWLFQRVGLFLVLCGLAIYLAYYRTDTQRIVANIQNILGKLPAPVVISDAAGFIIYANDTLSTVFKQSAADIIGKRYVDLFMTDIQEGKAMRYYIELFGDQANSVHELEIKAFYSEAKIKGRLTCLGSRSNRVMITLLSNNEEMAENIAP
jgi:transcriptional regulator with PAS, ATPase and Fis domain